MERAKEVVFAGRSTGSMEIARVILRGVGQVMFQGHAGTGLFFLTGIALASPLLAAGAILGAMVGPLVAVVLNFDRSEIGEGIYGFNSTLVGIALLHYLKPGAESVGLVVAGSVAATILTHLFRRKLPFPSYTAPFILATWLALVVAHTMAGTALDVQPVSPDETPVGFVRAVLNGEAEVIFGANAGTGLLILVGIALSNWRHAVVALVGSVAGTAVAHYHNDSAGTISLGIYGYNAALAAMAIYLWRPSLLTPILAAVVSVPITEFFPKALGLPALTAPFVVASWIILAVGGIESRFVRPLPEQSTCT
jgi:urea transporter